MSTRELIDAIVAGDATAIQTNFESAMMSRIAERMDALRVDVAKNMFKEAAEVKAGEEDDDEEDDSDEVELDEAGAYEGEVKDALVHLKKKGLMDKSSKEMHAHLKYHGFSSGAAKNAVSIAAAKQGMKEEVVELPEEFADMTLEELEEFMVSEEYEQLDELSKDTLGRYIKKASNHRVRLAGVERDLDDKETHLQKAKHGTDDDTYDALSKAQDSLRKQRNKVSDKGLQRANGISTAVKKLTK